MHAIGNPRAGQDAEPAAAEAWKLLRTLLGRHRRRFLIAAAELHLHAAQAGALLQLETPLPMRELADLLVCDTSNVTGLVDRLEARGLVVRQVSAQDRRVKLLVLTAAGRRLRAQLLQRIGRAPEGLQRLSVSEQQALCELLRRVAGED
ncbi:MAG: MarR family transcriptional regulator [Solirubrobacteraceae bacterium]|jgi:MarR family transcriptional regulator, organic hydroperoxide resistance regulator